jgi:hypothetical protein
MIKTATDCCALCQLSRIDNETPIEHIEIALKKLKEEKEINIEVGYTTGNGQTAVFTIVSPGEYILENNLKKLGFKMKHTFERRVGYPNLGDLKMYIKNL